jgi:crotonobetainyl-CoA:carnitine CoA-transferase CaiB-like acyl-CoA transferase
MDEPSPLLTGSRVVDLGNSVSTAYCSKLLAECGLEVVMVEPSEGHVLRRAEPIARRADGAVVSALFLYLAGGKRSVVLGSHPTKNEGLLENLLSTADVIVHDLTPELATGRGMSFERVRAMNRGVVVTTITPFGSSGPYAERSASDLTIYGLAGHLLLTGLPDREPLLPYGHQAHMFGGVLATAVTLACLWQSRRDRRARSVEVSLQEALAGALDTALNGYVYSGIRRGRYGNRLYHQTPLTDVYRTNDGYILLCVYTEAQWQSFCSMVGRPDWVRDERFARWEGRREHGQILGEVMVAWFAERTAAAALAECQRHRLPSCIAASVPELLVDPQLTARDFFRSIDHPNAGRLACPSLPFRFSTGSAYESGAPLLGQDSGEVARRGDSTARRIRPEVTADAADIAPLQGIRIVDLTHAWAGPFATLQLGYLGAEVIKVEGARRPDGTRFVSPDALVKEPPYETGGYYHEWNRNKRSMVINLELAEGIELLKALIQSADVVISNFSARVLPKWGLDWESLQRLKPNIVHVTMPAFGSQGPYRDFVGYGETLEGGGGLARLSGYTANEPMRSGVAYPDPVAGLYGAFAVVLGLSYREQHSEGVWLDLSQQEGVTRMVGEAILYYQLAGKSEEIRGNERPGVRLNEGKRSGVPQNVGVLTGR